MGFQGRTRFFLPSSHPGAGVTDVQAQLFILLPEIDLRSSSLQRTLYQLSQLSSLP